MDAMQEMDDLLASLEQSSVPQADKELRFPSKRRQSITVYDVGSDNTNYNYNDNNNDFKNSSNNYNNNSNNNNNNNNGNASANVGANASPTSRPVGGGNRCHRCSGELGPSRTEAMDRLWHPDCFTCRTCSSKIGNGSFYIEKDEVMCATCWARAVVCVRCGNPIQDKYYDSPEGPLHPACRASQAPPTSKLTTHAFCDGCGRDIQQSMMRVGGKTFHQQCFKCHLCHTPLTQYVEAGNGKFLCTGCNAPSGNSLVKCASCHLSILADFLMCGDQSYHTSCFKCSECKGSVDPQNMYTRLKKPVCARCVQ